LDLLADGAGLLFGIPRAGDGDLFAVDIFGAQGLAEPAFIMRDQMRGGGEDVSGGTVVALEANDLGAGKVMLEAQDVVDLRAAPAIDRLIVVADAADVFGGRLRGGWLRSSYLRRHPGMRDLLPRPACGEMVGVRGTLRDGSLRSDTP